MSPKQSKNYQKEPEVAQETQQLEEENMPADVIEVVEAAEVVTQAPVEADEADALPTVDLATPLDEPEAPNPEEMQEPETAGKVVLTAQELAALVQAEVAKALAANAGPVLTGSADFSRTLQAVRVWGTYQEALNKHVVQIANFEVQVTMPNGFTMGDLKRSLPRKLARTFTNFKKLRSVVGFDVTGPAPADLPSDFVAPMVVSSENHVEAINKAEGVDDEAQPTGEGILDTSEIDPATGLPPAIND